MVTDEAYETDTELASEASEDTSALEEDPAPEVSSEPAEADPAPSPDVPSDPVEVVTVEDLLDRLAGESQEDGQTEEPPQEEETTDSSPESGLPAAQVDGGPIEVVGMDKVLKHLETIQGAVDHPMLTTPFEDYTVTEGLLLLLFLSVVVAACVKMLKGGFAWLR